VLHGDADAAWSQQRNNLHVELLVKIEKRLVDKFDEIHIWRGYYLTQMLTDEQEYHQSARTGMLRILSG
jgi:hypothetical protein